MLLTKQQADSMEQFHIQNSRLNTMEPKSILLHINFQLSNVYELERKM